MEKQKRYDGLKKKYCDDNGLILEYIKYTSDSSYKNLEKRVVQILRKHGFEVRENYESSEDENSLYNY